MGMRIRANRAAFVPVALAGLVCWACGDSPAALRGAVGEGCDEQVVKLEAFVQQYRTTRKFPYDLDTDDGRHALYDSVDMCARVRTGGDALRKDLSAFRNEIAEFAKRLSDGEDAAKHLDRLVELARRINTYPIK